MNAAKFTRGEEEQPICRNGKSRKATKREVRGGMELFVFVSCQKRESEVIKLDESRRYCEAIKPPITARIGFSFF